MKKFIIIGIIIVIVLFAGCSEKEVSANADQTEVTFEVEETITESVRVSPEFMAEMEFNSQTNDFGN